MIPNRLTPCLVHRDLSTSPVVPGKVPCSPTRPSLPIYHRRKEDVTVPLRECCQSCERITEECLEKGEHWQEKFSKGAKRRRSVSLDQYNSLTTATFSTLCMSKCDKASKDSSEAVGDDPEFERRPCNFSITVDEVDKRRKSFDLGTDQNKVSIQCDETEPLFPGSSSTLQFHLRDASYSSASSTNTTTTTEELVPDFDSKHRLRSSPIEEEDEAELFPLPRRTPSGTPSPAPSPHGSTSCLTSSIPGIQFLDRSGSASSKESFSSRNSVSQESLLKASLSRKLPSVGLGIVTSGSRVSNSGVRAASPDLALSVEKSGIDDMGLKIIPDGSSLAGPKQVPIVATSTSVASSVEVLAPPLDTSPHSKAHTPNSGVVKSSHTVTAPTSSSSLSPHKRKLSLVTPFIKAGGALKGMSVDVLKGVSTMTAGSAF